MLIAILGTGDMAAHLVKGLARAGHRVVLGSRHPGRNALGVTTMDHASAISGASLVVNTLPGAASVEVTSTVAPYLANRILLDVSNAITEEEELIYPDSSVAEQLQAALPNTMVVKSLSTIAGAVAIDPSRLAARSTVFVSGDDERAKNVVRGVLCDLGWDQDSILDLGGIRTARAVEHYLLLFRALLRLKGDGEFNVAVVR